MSKKVKKMFSGGMSSVLSSVINPLRGIPVAPPPSKVSPGQVKPTPVAAPPAVQPSAKSSPAPRSTSDKAPVVLKMPKKMFGFKSGGKTKKSHSNW